MKMRLTNHRSRFLIVGALLVAFLFSYNPTSAQVISGRFVSSVYGWEQFDTVGVSNKIIRATQAALVDFSYGNFSFHANVHGAGSIQGTHDNDFTFRSFNLYGKMRNIGDVADVSFGRVPYFAGVGNGIVDGLLLTTRITGEHRVTVYGGANAPQNLSFTGWRPLSNNFTIGGQYLTSAVKDMRLGLSYINRQTDFDPYKAIRPDSLFNAITVEVQPPPAKEQLIGADAAYIISRFTAYGRYEYDLNNEKTQRTQLGMRYAADKHLTLSGEFIHRAPRVSANSFFSFFPQSTINEYEGGIEYMFGSLWNAFGRIARVNYVDETSMRYTVGVSHQYGGVTYRKSDGYAGELSTVSVYGSYPLLENFLTPNVGVTYSSYRLNPAAGLESSLAALVGATVHPARTISVDVQAQWLKNRILDSDLRLFAKFNFWFVERLSNSN